ncbi:MAG: hypothetical protein IKI40_03185 [Treponema sp.]|nr:hypothetical protein [Treponema sp.]
MEVTGLRLDQIKDYSPSKFREYLERKNNKKFSFLSAFPVIGRGNVLRDNLVTSIQLNDEIDKILR